MAIENFQFARPYKHIVSAPQNDCTDHVIDTCLHDNQ